MKKHRLPLLALLVLITLSISTGGIASQVRAQEPEPWAFFAHDVANHTIVWIDTVTGRATVVGPTNFATGASGMARARGPVPGPGNVTFPEGTIFGLFRDNDDGTDWLVTLDLSTGKATKILRTSRPIVARGIAFGPDGVTLYVIEEQNGLFSTVDTVTGAVTEIADTGYRAASLEWDPDTGSLIAISRDTLIRLNPADGTVTRVTPIQGGPSGSRASALARSSTGKWYVIIIPGGDVATLDIDTGMITNILGNVGPDSTDQIGATVFAPLADLAVIKTAAPDPAVAGSSLTYTLTVTNNGPSQATGVTLTDTLPPEVSFESATPSQGSCSETAGTVTCNLGDLAVGGSATVEIVVTLAPSLADGTTLTNTAQVAGNEPDSNPGNNTDTAETQVIRQADLAITKTGDPNPVTAGNQITYTLTITNLGPSDASGVRITDTLPAGVSFVSGSAGCTETTPGTVTCDIGDLAAGDTATVEIIVTLDPEVAGTLTNTAEATANEPDPDPSNNVDTEEIEITILADFGDAEEPPYPSLAASSGAHHLDSTKEWLGLGVDSEVDAKVPDLDLFDDGVVFRSWYPPYRPVRVPITVSTSGLGTARYGREPERRLYVRGWIDYNLDGDWDDPGELVVDCNVAPGTLGYCNGRPAHWPNAQQPWQTFIARFNVGLIKEEGPTWARFRLSYGEPPEPTGPAAYGEVEDYRITIFLHLDP